jgi:hypothetical protein
VRSGREPQQVDADLGDDDLSGALPDAGDGLQSPGGFSERDGAPVDLLVDRGIPAVR